MVLRQIDGRKLRGRALDRAMLEIGPLPGMFLQGDQSVANQAGAAFRADMNTELQAIVSNSSGASSPATTYAYQWWADTTSGLMKQRNAANSAWVVRGTLAESFVVARSSNTIIGVGDYGRTFDCTSSFSQTFTAAATLADGFWCEFRNSGTGIITLDPNGAELIDGAATVALQPGESCVVACTGSAFKTIGRLDINSLTQDTNPDLSADFLLTYDASGTGQKKVLASTLMTRAHISGLIQANNAGDAANDIDISVGHCIDSTNTTPIVLASAITKRLDANWAVGTNQGGLDTGAEATSTWYYLWAIKRSDTGVVDVLFSVSATAPTMPGSYDSKRLIGAVFNDGSSALTAFHAYEISGGGLDVVWDSPTLDVNLANTLTTSRRTDVIKVPTAFSVLAWLNVVISDASAGSTNWVYCPDQADQAPSVSVAPLANSQTATSSATVMGLCIRTNSSGAIAARSTLATVDVYRVVTLSFQWSRR